MPEWIEKNYAQWKITAWRAGRAFIAAFIPTFGFMLTSVTVETFESKETLVKLIVAIGLSSLTAGIVAVGKYLRDSFPESEIVNKLPI